ncbi:MAG: peptidoglycan endopeptidase [Paraburkholderia sp.]|uniref:C40 family peptidase n=1 Tax=Paraburkholderia sp. TaxID=1926495 RepID=UPI0011F98A76|nr:C40 family peptidase [Paraburkholderia sp.]TAM04831.1 MAG: peptidoglycan endopeptidase [Paraburkholderia sp.]TAM31237.1 MAG: peptidoglycan endopeptidase [Paraburkholderia sp.]
MRRLWLPLLIMVFLAACSSTPERYARRGGSSTAIDASRTRPSGFPNFVDHSVGREEISIQAMGLVGIPYRWGGNTPDSGFDCSGLVKYVFARAAFVDLPRTTADMGARGESIQPDEIAAGDLVFFNTTGRPHSHVGIYVGKLRFVNAPSTGGTVRLDYLTNPYWAKRFDGIRRMAPPKATPQPFETPTWEASAPAQPAPAVAAAAVPIRVTSVNQNRPMPAAAPAPVVPAYAATRPAAAPADAFEPPPAAPGAAQMQARVAGGATPAMASANAPDADSQPDAIAAAADAFEPPPPAAAMAERQAAQAGSTTLTPAATSRPPVQIMRASTAQPVGRAPTQTNDDPIARFANSAF